MNELFGYAIINCFIGVLIGIVYAWNKKVITIVMIVGIIFVVISSFYVGIDNIYSATNPWWKTLFSAAFVFIGIKIGEIIYKEDFKK